MLYFRQQQQVVQADALRLICIRYTYLSWMVSIQPVMNLQQLGTPVHRLGCDGLQTRDANCLSRLVTVRLMNDSVPASIVNQFV